MQQKAILLTLSRGGKVLLGVDYFIEADRPDHQGFTTVTYDTLEGNGSFDIKETPEEIQKLINSL